MAEEHDAEEHDSAPGDSAAVALTQTERDGAPEQLPEPRASRGTLTFVTQNLHAAWQKARLRDAGDSAQADTPVAVTETALPAAVAGPASADLEAGLAAAAGSVAILDLAPTDTWWAQRWIDKATPGEVAAMRQLLS